MVAGEPSGDRLGAGLIRELKALNPQLQFSGIGGPKMAAAGCQILYDMDRIGVMGLDGLGEKIFDILKIRRRLIKRWINQPPGAFVGIDVPDFNLTVERRLKHCGITCVHYVSPTVWAWRGYRIHKIRRSINHMLALFPFEETYYQGNDVPVTCVGHPLADEIHQLQPARARAALGLADNPDGGPVIALLPGSRRSEVKRLSESMVVAARQLMTRVPGVTFILPFANQSVANTFYQFAGPVDDLPLTTFDGQSRQVLEAADIAVLASGTASLEAALLGTPHVVVYRLPTLSNWLLQMLRQVDHFAMPNHLLPKPMVPELVNDQVTPENIVEAVQGFLQHPQRMATLKQEFAKILTTLRLGADKRAAEAVISLMSGPNMTQSKDCE